MLMKRILTALILIPLTIAILFFFPPVPFLIATAIVTLAGAWEWSNLMGLKRLSTRLLYFILMLLILFNLTYLLVISLFSAAHPILLVAVLWWILATVLIVLYPRASAGWGNSIFWRGLMGIVTLVPCWVALNDIRNMNGGRYFLLFMFILIWGADTAAYFTGKKWGKNKLAPHVSPGKSIQGLVGAIIFTSFITLAFLWATHAPYSIWLGIIVLSFFTVIFSVLGDLLESMLKRQVGIKDSGQLLPGHGGLLDRIDSLTAAAPVFALGLFLLAKLKTGF